jgi:alginate O-acetyltransferase complex protein AlgI
MLFSDPSFFAFFSVYLLLHFVVPPRFRLGLIIVGSTVFYAWWKWEYTWLPYLLIAIAYTGSRQICFEKNETRRKAITAVTVALLFVPLVVFKYTNFIAVDVLGPLIGIHYKILDVSLPLGVSFITFTLTAFVVDIYRRTFPGVPGVSTATAYVLFFPHLIAGPILRPKELIPQLECPQPARGINTAGIVIFTIGLVKKLVIADQIAGAVDRIYALTSPTGPEALLAIYGFSAQIYCDFSGYTDMAIGLALLIGVTLPNNFLRPYASTSIVDFWRRWHITLSFWLRDYLYIPLGGNRLGRRRASLNMIITMVLGGLWHGASWTFVVWGFLHGLGIAVVHLYRDALRAGRMFALPVWLGVLLTFHFVTLLWVFFRAPTLGKAASMLRGFFGGHWSTTADYASQNAKFVIVIVIFFLLHGFDDHRLMRWAARRVRAEVLWPVIIMLWVLAITVSHGTSERFIYFEF